MGKQKNVNTTEDIITKEGKAVMALARRKSLEKQLAPSIFGSDSTSIDFGGYNYNSSELAGGHFGKAAEQGDWSKWSMPDDMAYKAFQQQDMGDLILDTLAGGSKLAVAGFLDMAGSWDLGEISNIASNEAMSETGNWVQRQADKLQDSAKEENTIYQDGDNMWTGAYWANQGQQLGYSVGIVGEMVAEQALLAFATGGTGNAAALGSKARLLKPLFQQGAMGLAGGFREAYMNARETQENVYEKFSKAGFSDEEAKAKADEAAHISFKTEAGSLVVLNTLQNLTLFGGISKVKPFSKGSGPQLQMGFSSFGEQLLEKALPKSTSKLGRRTVQYGVIPMATESVEEGIQTTSGAYGEWTVGDKKEAFDPFNTELRDSMIGGALGGVLLGAGAKGISKFNEHLTSKQFNSDYQNFINTATDRTANTFIQQEAVKKEYAEAQTNYSKNKSKENLDKLNKAEEAVKQAKYNSHLANAINALEYDYMKGDGTQAFDAHVGQMQNILEAVNNKDINKLREYGLVMANGKERFEGSFEVIANTFEQNIEDSQFIKQSLENNLVNVTADFKSAFDITRKEYTNSKHLQEINEIEADLNQIYVTDNYVKQLSTEGQTRFRLENELAALKQIDANTETKRLSVEDKARIKEIEKDLEGLSYTSKDRRVIPNTNRQDYINAEVSKVSLGQAIDQNNLELTTLRNSNKIAEKIKKRVKAKVKKAKTPNNIKKAKEEAEQAGVADEEFEKEAARKEAEIQANAKVNEINKSGNTISKPQPAQTVEKSKPAEPDTASLFSQFMKEGKLSNAAPEENFSSRRSIEEVNDELKNKAVQFVERKSQQLGKDITLEDVIVDSIERNGLKATEDVFNGISKLMETAGKDISDANSLYYKYFEEDINVFKSFTVEEANTATDQVEAQARKNTELKDEFNVLGQPVSKPKVNKNIEDSRTNKSAPKIAFNFQEYDREGNTFTITSTELKGDNFFILDSEFVNTGDELLVEVIEDNSMPITSVNSQGKVTKTTWGEFKQGVTTDSQSYLNKIPMGIYKQVGEEKVLVGYIHDATWYTPRNITEVHGQEEQAEIAKKGYENTVAIRKQILADGGKGKITVSQRQFGSLDKINKSNNSAPITISEATGETQLARITQDSNGNVQLETKKGVPFKGVLEGDLNATRNGVKVFNSGGIADIRYLYTKPDGTKVYMALPILQKKSTAVGNLAEDLNPTIYNSLKFATLANIVLNNTNIPELLQQIESEFGFTITDANNIRKEIQENLRVDVKTNVKNYLEFFVRMSGDNFVLDNKTKPSLKDLQNDFNVGKFKYFFGDKGAILKSSFNVNYSKLNANTLQDVTIPTIDSAGKVETKYKGYNDLVKNHTYTNIRSHEITKHDGSKQWISDVHPVITYNLEANAVQENIQQAAEEVVQEMETLNELGIPEDVAANLSPEDIALLESLKSTMKQNNTHSSRRVMSEQDADGIASGKVDLLTDLEFRELISSLKHSLISTTDFNTKITVGHLKAKLDSVVSNNVEPVLTSYKERLEKFSQIPSLEQFTKELQVRINKLESVIEQQDKIVGDKGVLTKELNKLFGLNLEDVREDEFSSDNNFQKSFLEKDIKLSYSNKLRMSFFGIKELKVNSSQEVVNELTGMPKYQSADYVELILKGVTTEIPSNWDTLMHKFDTNYAKTQNPIFNQLKNKLKDLPPSLKNELLYKLVSSRFTAHKVINSIQKGKNGAADTYVLTVIDENSSKENIKIKREIRNNFIYDSPLTMVDVATNDRILNIDQAKKYKAAFEKHRKADTYKDGYTVDNAKTLKVIFNAIGINLSDNTIKEYLEYNDPFNKYQGVLHYVDTHLGTLINKSKSKPVVVTDKDNNLYDTANKALNELVDLEIALNGTNIAKSIRVGGKTLQGVIQNTAASDTLKELIAEDSQLLDKLSAIGYSSKNLLVTQLQENPQLREILNLSFSSPDSYKINGKKNYSDTGYDKLSDTDGIISNLGLYTNERGNVQLNNAEDIKLGLNFRVGQMPFMTLSDKGRMVYMKTILLNATDEQIDLDGDQDAEIRLSKDITDLMFEQVFESEYSRILDAYANEDPNVKSFSEASKIFTFLPIFNTLKVNGVNIHDIIKNRVETNQPLPSLETFRGPAKDMLTKYINSEVDQKLNSKGEGIIADSKLYEDGQIKNIDSKYLSKFKGTPLEKARKFFAEHAVNNLVHQVNVYQLFLGDMAYYTKVSTDKVNSNNEVIKEGVISKDGYVRSNVIEENYLDVAETIGQVVDKRSASLIAPGFSLANANDTQNGNSQYMQLQLVDVESVSTIIEPLVRASKDEISEQEENAFNTLADENATPEMINQAFNILEEENPELRDYFNIEGTDAQEYRTWKSHIDIMFRQGNLTEQETDLLKEAYRKLSEGKFDEVTKEETSVVMQPLKPVYTGMIPLYNNEGKVISMRPMYIKSSSFPLLPQITKNLKIDNLRKNLEALEEAKGMTVAASYQTANKIGANKTMLTVDDLYNKTYEQISGEVKNGRNLLDSAAVILDTKNFKIQQESPDKISKYLAKNKDNEISMGSQFWKVILGNGINSMEDAVFPNKFSTELLEAVGIGPKEMLTGNELDQINLHVFKNFSDTKVNLLYSRLGLDRDTQFSNLDKNAKKEVFEKVVEILKEEVSTRNYPEYLTESLNLITDETGDISLESPIFLDANANKFESLLLSLVANATIFHKLPGLGHISSSSEGFERITNLNEISEEDRQGITWFDRPTGRLKSTVLEDGTIKESEVLVKSHYRRTRLVNGEKVTELVDFSSDTYSETIVEDGKVVGRKLKMDMMDEELLSNFSFRIPTSSHQSGVILKIVGFLPKESGDMLLVPAEHTVQLGEDYDIDKRYIYKSNYIFDGDRISKLEYRKSIKEDQNEFDRLFEALLGEDTPDTDKESKVRIKMYENAMIDIYKSVFQSPSKEVQQKIFKPLSVGVAKETAFNMDKKLNTDKTPYFSSLSDTYQRKLLKAGADGKGGIGVHSNAVTLEAQMQRLNNTSKLELREEMIDPKLGPYTVPAIERIGPLVSDSKLGASQGFKSIDGRRDVSDQHGENQNVSTDNINEQIMAKRNENSYTMGVYALMATRGFDLSQNGVVQNDGKPMHIPSLFINQPIIRDYVKLKSQQDSISGEFIADKDTDILFQLMNMYGYTPKKKNPSLGNFMSDTDYALGSRYMTGQALYDSLSEDIAKKNNVMQAAVLQKFIKFKSEASVLSEVQGLISLSTGGLGVSYFETLQRIDVLNRLPKEIDTVLNNAYKLVGDYAMSAEDLGVLAGPDAVSAKDLEQDGYTKIGDYFWKPNTIEGIMLIDSLKASQDLMDVFFPYKQRAIDNSITAILREKNTDGSVKSKTTLEQKYEIMTELKSFMNSYDNSEYFKGDVNEERRRLFMDTENNSSLASIVKDIQDKKLPLASNPFIMNLLPQLKAVTEPSLLLYTSSESTSLDSYTEYDGFSRLLLDDTTVLGEYNGETMTPKKLAYDLISYSMMADSQNGATGFDTLVPQKYLQNIGYKQALNSNFKKVENNPELMSTFVEQYFQHNPERTQILSGSTISPDELRVEDEVVGKKLEALATKIANGETVNINSVLQDLKSFEIIDRPEFNTYVSIRNPSIKNSENKFNLYKFNHVTGRYEQIPTLGTTGMKEYNAQVFSQSSIIPNLNKETTGKKYSNNSFRYFDTGVNKTQAMPEISAQLPESLGVQGVLEAYYKSPNTDQKTKDFIASLIEYGDLGATLVYTAPANGALGQYNADTNEIYIHPDIYDKLLSKNPNLGEVRDIVREVMLEEIIHSMTVKEFNKYVKTYDSATGQVTLVDNAPLFATKLVSLYQAAKESLPYNPNDNVTYYSKNIYEFMAGMFVAPDYRAAVEKANPGIVKQFLDILRNMFGSVYKAATGKTLEYSDETFNAVYDLLKARKNKTNVAFSNNNIVNPMEQVLNQESISGKEDYFKNNLSSKKELDNIVDQNNYLSPVAKLLANKKATLHNRIVPRELESGGLAFADFENNLYLTDVAIDETKIQEVVNKRKDLPYFRSEVIVHEEIHRFTTGLFYLKENLKEGTSLLELGMTQSEINFLAEIESLYEQYLKNKPKEVKYSQPDESVQEFLTYGLTNPAFIKEISKIKVQDSTVLSKLISAIKKLLGDNPSIQQALVKSFENFMIAESSLEDISSTSYFFTDTYVLGQENDEYDSRRRLPEIKNCK